jgi:phosphatidate cytidylyltransferase
MKRVLTALVLIPLVLYAVLLGPSPLVFALVALSGMLCYREYCGIADGYGIHELGPVGYAAGLGMLACSGSTGSIFLTMLALAAMTLAMRADDLKESLPRASALLFGVVYIFGSRKCAILLREFSPYWLLFALAINWVGDIAAYYVGKNFGKRKLAPRVSPGKTWEGTAASLVAAVAFGAAYLQRFTPGVGLVEAVAISTLANAAGQLGDLAESALKRGAGVKDSGALLPGHGGLLDRVDSALFTMPVVYVYLAWVASRTG